VDWTVIKNENVPLVTNEHEYIICVYYFHFHFMNVSNEICEISL